MLQQQLLSEKMNYFNRDENSNNNDEILDFKSISQISENLLEDYLTKKEDLISSILKGSLQITKSKRGSLMFLNKHKNMFWIHTAKGVKSNLTNIPMPFAKEGVLGHVFSTKKPLLLNDVEEFLGRKNRSYYTDKSALCVPLTLANDIFGFICFNNKDSVHGFDSFDYTMSSYIGNITSTLISACYEKKWQKNDYEFLIEKNRLSIEQNNTLKLISKISKKIIMSSRLDNLLNIIIDASVDILKIKRSSIMLADKHSKTLTINAAKGISANLTGKIDIDYKKSLSGLAAQTKKPLFIQDVNKIKSILFDSKYKENSNCKNITEYSNKSAIVIPLIIKNKLLGVMNFSCKEDKTEFNKFDYFVASLIANQASIVLNNALLNEKIKNTHELREKFKIAKQIHNKFVPNKITFNKGLSVAGLSLPCNDFGGDYYNFIPFDKNKFGIVIGDVSGHGLDAGLLMITVRAFLKSFLYQNLDLFSIFTGLNTLIYKDIKHDWFMTLFFGIYNKKTSEFNYLSAGHYPVLLYRSSSNSWTELIRTDIPLGVLDNNSYQSVKSVKVKKNDIIIFFTDGVIDVMSNDPDFGIEKIKNFVESCYMQKTKNILKSVYSDVLSNSSKSPVNDDMSLIIIKI